MTESLDAARQAEHEKYHRAYGMNPNYRMGQGRMMDAMRDLKDIPTRGSLLDVSCGRGEMIRFAKQIGFKTAMGTEVVPDLIDDHTVIYAAAHKLPFVDGAFEVVTMFDVIEHLIPGDDELACKEMLRVASKHVLLTANNKPSFNKAGDDLHINKRPYECWRYLFEKWFAPHKVTWIKGTPTQPRHYVSEAWRVDLVETA